MSKCSLRFRSSSTSETTSFGSDTNVRCWARLSETSKGNFDLASAAAQLTFGEGVDWAAAADDRIVIVWRTPETSGDVTACVFSECRTAMQTKGELVGPATTRGNSGASKSTDFRIR
jgi:hypothetical protein